jgi:hypothetical protein
VAAVKKARQPGSRAGAAARDYAPLAALEGVRRVGQRLRDRVVD